MKTIGTNWLVATIIGSLALTALGCGAEGEFADDELTATSEEALNAGKLIRGEYLFANQEIWSSNCAFRLRMQTDGNLVARSYPSGSSIWSSGTVGNDWAYLNFQAGDGNVCIRPNGGGGALFCTHGGFGETFNMQTDGNVVLRSAGGSSLWSSHSVRTPQRSCFSPETITLVNRSTYVQQNVDLPGSDMMAAIVGVHYTTCGSECSTRSACKAWTWVPPTAGGGLPLCYLKNAVPASRVATGMWSGTIRTAISGGI